MKPLFVLLIAFLATLVIDWLVTREWNTILAGNVAMFVMLCFTAIAHFVFTKGMQLMIPALIPYKKAMVYITGVAEVAAGIALLFMRYRYAASMFLLVLFILMLPANINAAYKQVDYEKAAYDGKGLNYLWFRVPLQALFIAWVWYFGIRVCSQPLSFFSE